MSEFFKTYTEFVALLDNSPVVLVGLGPLDDISCPLCADSAAALTQNGITFTYLDAANNPTLIDSMGKKAAIVSLPYLFVYAKPYGDYEQIREGLFSGELHDLVLYRLTT